ncbi:MAG: ATP-binding protein [Alphaproteobacteria bacterium]|nr:MAG: ATP-binding protein [Alphaproteobacteria bacterium]
MKEARAQQTLSPEDLRWYCPADWLEFETTADVEPAAGVVGQDDALEALRFGLEFNAEGQNVYVRGLTGTGRMSLVRQLLEKAPAARRPVRDYCYVHNFKHADKPCLIALPKGEGKQFKSMMERLIEFIIEQLGPALSSENMRARRADIDEAAQAEMRKFGEPFESELKANGLTLVPVQMGRIIQPTVMAVIKGEAVPYQQLEAEREKFGLTEADLESYRQKIAHFARSFEDVSHKIVDFQQTHRETLRKLYEDEARVLMSPYVKAIADKFKNEAIALFLADLEDDLIEHYLPVLGDENDFTERYQVNLVLDRSQNDNTPIIIEASPSLTNLLGSIEREFVPGGAFRSDHRMIQPGSLLLADGGYLIVQVRDVLEEPGSWKVLLRTLRTGCLEIVPSEFQVYSWFGPQLKPEAIPVDVKVILIGDPGLYNVLDMYDPDFSFLFKVLADFNETIPINKDAVKHYAGVIARIAAKEGLPPYSSGAVGALVEHGARIAGRRDHLTARFGRLADIAREAAWLCSDEQCPSVSAAHVRQAIDRGRHRANLPARHFREMIVDGTIGVATQGTMIGQINGIAVIESGPLTYGFPNRITATIGAGTAGAVNIDREADLSGAIHTKGFYILSGLLRHLLRTDHPLAFSASIAFEQSYGGIDGDSASGAEICALLSALTEMPLRQDLAMTGAIDQLGNIQPVGAVTEKVEGFYLVCKEQGLTGTQGIALPRSNVRNLMLHPEVVDACREGKFHVYPLDTIHDALELFTGCVAGQPDAEGNYPEGTLLCRAEQKAYAYWKMAMGANEAGAEQ